MNSIIEKIKTTFFSKEFILFVIIGIINTFTGTIFSYIYSSFLNESIAFIPGYISGMIVSYLLNSIITFKESLNLTKFIKFSISCMPNFAIQFICVLVIVNLMHFDKLIAYMLAAIIGVPITFLLLKFFAFSKNKNK